jgi:NACalpha-BTF3-like transcription factor
MGDEKKIKKTREDRSKSLKEKRERKTRDNSGSSLVEGFDTPLKDGFNPQSRRIVKRYKGKLVEEETKGSEPLDQETPIWKKKRDEGNRKKKDENDEIKFYKSAIKLFEKQKTSVSFEQVVEALKEAQNDTKLA